jgi:actin related protein 2/3 complex subunit 2
MPPPLTLEFQNRIVHDTLLSQFTMLKLFYYLLLIILLFLFREKPDLIDITIADFNQVIWHLFSTDDGFLTISCSCKCYPTLQKFGLADSYIKKIYGNLVVSAVCIILLFIFKFLIIVFKKKEPKFDVSLKVCIGKKQNEAENLATKISQLSRNMLASVFINMFEKASKREQFNQLVQIDYRPAESIWLKLDGDRVCNY